MAIEITTVQKIQEVSALLALPNSRILAGGTTFSQTDDRSLHLVDISGLENLDGIKLKGNRIEIGPLTTLNTLAGSDLLKKYAPALAEAAANAGTPEFRNRATLGGNLCAEKIGDTAAALLAGSAKLTVKTESDFRELLIDRFWDASGKNDLQYDEWVTRVSIPLPKSSFTGAAFGRIGDWNETSFPAAAAAVQLSLDEKHIITSVRGGLRLGTNKIGRTFELERALKNHPLTEETLQKAVRAMAPAARNGLDEKEFTAFLSGLIRRACSMAEERRTL